MSETEISITKFSIGVLALQGAVEEHVKAIRTAAQYLIVEFPTLNVDVREIKLPDHMLHVDGIIIPGGESTAMAIIGERWGLFDPLKQWVEEGRPIWGTCAGMILLSDHAIKQREGGQALVGGLDVHVCRNFFGSQIQSSEYELSASFLSSKEQFGDVGDTGLFTAVFIRAPAILKAGPAVAVLATIRATPHESVRAEIAEVLGSMTDKRTKELEGSRKYTDGEAAKLEVIVAVRQGNILATAFHPELTNDVRWHVYFCRMVKSYLDKRL